MKLGFMAFKGEDLDEALTPDNHFGTEILRSEPREVEFWVGDGPEPDPRLQSIKTIHALMSRCVHRGITVWVNKYIHPKEGKALLAGELIWDPERGLWRFQEQRWNARDLANTPCRFGTCLFWDRESLIKHGVEHLAPRNARFPVAIPLRENNLRFKNVRGDYWRQLYFEPYLYGEYKQRIRQYLDLIGWEEDGLCKTDEDFEHREFARMLDATYIIGQPGTPDVWGNLEKTPTGCWNSRDEYLNTGSQEPQPRHHAEYSAFLTPHGVTLPHDEHPVFPELVAWQDAFDALTRPQPTPAARLQARAKAVGLRGAWIEYLLDFQDALQTLQNRVWSDTLEKVEEDLNQMAKSLIRDPGASERGLWLETQDWGRRIRLQVLERKAEENRDAESIRLELIREALEVQPEWREWLMVTHQDLARKLGIPIPAKMPVPIRARKQARKLMLRELRRRTRSWRRERRQLLAEVRRQREGEV